MKINRIQLSNVLSFSEENPLDIELSNLNFIVGPNNSGKTNVLRSLKYFFEFVSFEINKMVKGREFYQTQQNVSVPKDVFDKLKILRANDLSKPFSMKITFEFEENGSSLKEFSEIKKFLELFGIALTQEMITNRMNEVYNRIFTPQTKKN